MLDIDIVNKRISLGMKQVEVNPWTQLEERYPVGTVLKGKVRNITDFGIFVGIEEGIDGLVHVSDLSWTQRVKHPSEMYQKGDEVEAVVLNIDVENERFSLGIKQLHEDPWDRIPETYPRGAKVKGKVIKVTDFGAFIELEPGIEGLCHVSEFSDEHVDNARDFIKPDAEIEAMIIDVDPNERKIGLSMKALQHAANGVDYRAYLAGAAGDASRTTLGDAFKAQLATSEEEEAVETEEKAEAKTEASKENSEA